MPTRVRTIACAEIPHLHLLKSPITMIELRKSVYASRMRTQPCNYRDVLLHSILKIDGFLLLYRTVCVDLVLL